MQSPSPVPPVFLVHLGDVPGPQHHHHVLDVPGPDARGAPDGDAVRRRQHPLAPEEGAAALEALHVAPLLPAPVVLILGLVADL